MALLEDLKEGSGKKLWAEAMSICVTTANQGGTSSFEKCHRIPPTPSGVQRFGTVGYMRATTRKHNLEPRRVRCIILLVGFAHNHPSGIFRVRTLATGDVVCPRNVTWYPAAAEQSEENKGEVATVEETTRGLALVMGQGYLAQ